jgi:hypothetical protein
LGTVVTLLQLTYSQHWLAGCWLIENLAIDVEPVQRGTNSVP